MDIGKQLHGDFRYVGLHSLRYVALLLSFLRRIA